MKKLIYIVAVPASVRSFLSERMRFLADKYDVSAICSPGKEHELFRSEGLKTHAIPIERRISPLKDLVSLWRLYRLLRREKPDIVHTMTPKAGLLGTIAAWAARVPVRIAMFNGELKLPNPLVRGIVRATNAITCFFATHLNADGYGTKEYVEEQHVTHKPVKVFWHGNINGIDLEKFKPTGKRALMRKRLNLPVDSVVFIYVGRIVHDKGIDELVPAFVKLLEEGARADLVLVGREEELLDPIAAETKTLIQDHPHIHAVGGQDNVPDWLEMSDVFVLPSHREGCNCSILEAAAMGIPAISCNIRGCNEVIVDEETGVLVPCGDASKLYEQMLRMYSSKDLRQVMGKMAQQRVRTKYNRDDVWRAMLHYYASITK